MSGHDEVLRASVLYWGIPGSGKSTNLNAIYAKLRPENRGELSHVPTPIDSTVNYERLPIELGEMGGTPTQIEIIAVPSAAEQTPTRKQLIDGVSGVVLVIDSQPDRLEENVESVDELRNLLAAYGRTLAELPVVAQYNKRDLCDPYAIEELHRRLALPGVAVFEAVASEGTGVLQSLTTVCKRVVRVLRENMAQEDEISAPLAAESDQPGLEEGLEEELESAELLSAEPEVLEPQAIGEEEEVDLAPELESSPTWLEEAILEDGNNSASGDLMSATQMAFAAPFDEAMKPAQGARLGADLELVSVGDAERTGTRSLAIPLVLGNADGETLTLTLTIGLDPLMDDSE